MGAATDQFYNIMTVTLLCILFLIIESCTCRIPITHVKGNCAPGMLVWVDCNLCICNREGRPNGICALMWCPPPPTRKAVHILDENFLDALS